MTIDAPILVEYYEYYRIIYKIMTLKLLAHSFSYYKISMLEVSHPWRPAPPRWHSRGERGEHTRRVCVAPMNPRGSVSLPEAVMLKIASLLSQFIVYLSSAHFSFILVSVNLVLFVPLFQHSIK